MATVLSDLTSPDVFLHAMQIGLTETMLVVEDAASGVEAALAAGMGLSGSVQWSELEMPIVRESLSGVRWVELLAALKQTQMFASTTMPVAGHRPQWDGMGCWLYLDNHMVSNRDG